LKKSETKREGTKERRKYGQAEVKEIYVSQNSSFQTMKSFVRNTDVHVQSE
jgi:hypothetical protein